jgi:transcriptional regulator with XRE-family HTH domain
MPIDDLTALGQKMREARKNKELTQQELSEKQIANIEKGKMNPSYLILRALAKVLHISLDTLINPDISLEDEGVNQMKMLYSSCPPEMRDTLLHHTQETVKELTELSEIFEMN